MRHDLFKGALMLAAAGALGHPALAEEPGRFYAGAGYQWLGGDVGNNSYDIGAVALRGGYNYNAYLGAEGEVAIGVTEQALGADGDVTIAIDTGLQSAFGAFAVGRFPASGYADFFARAGAVHYTLESEVSTFDFEDDYTGFAYGVGTDVYIGRRHGLRLAYSSYELDDRVGVVELGYVFRFR